MMSSHLISRVGRRIQNQRRWSFQTSSRHRRHTKRQINPPVMWNIQGMRGKMPANCLWHACQALFVGLLLFSIGGVMSFLGFEADGVFTSNGTAVAGGRAYFYEDARGANIKFSKLSYLGPIVMGIGGFIVVAACVMTFEARDSAAKVGPAAFVAADETAVPYPIITKPKPVKRCIEFKSVATQTNETSSDALHNLHIFDKKNLMETFRRLSRTVRQSSSKEEDIPRYPSAPNLYEEDDPGKSSTTKPPPIIARRSSCLPKFRNRVPPVLMRQAMSIDCSSSSPFVPIVRPTSITSNNSSVFSATTSYGASNLKAKRGICRTNTNTSATSDAGCSRTAGSTEVISPSSQSVSFAVSCASGDIDNASCSMLPSKSTGSTSQRGTVDLHLPNGMVTLSVVNTNGNSVLKGSSTCLRTLSPHPSYQSDDSSFDMVSVKSDNVLLPKSPMKNVKFRSESLGRPMLVRQSKVEQPEIIYMPDSDEEQQKPIPEAEHESDTDST